MYSMYKEIESAGELTSNGVDFIKEDDACFLCARHLKQLPHHPCSLDTGRSHITVHISHITYHRSPITGHISHITGHLSQSTVQVHIYFREGGGESPPPLCMYPCFKGIGSRYSERFVTKYKRVDLISADKQHYDCKDVSCDNAQFNS